MNAVKIFQQELSTAVEHKRYLAACETMTTSVKCGQLLERGQLLKYCIQPPDRTIIHTQIRMTCVPAKKHAFWPCLTQNDM